MKKAAKELLASLAGARDLATAIRCVKELEKDHGFKWRAVGDREGNYGSINIGSDPGYAFVERITNAIDAVIEGEALRRLEKKGKQKRTPSSPREAVEDWFGVPGGRVANLRQLQKGMEKRQALADKIVVSILDGDNKKTPTLEVRDYGVGLTGALIPKTILSLNDQNKIDKHYLAGAYGQGGSTALAFSPKGVLFVSRRQPDLLPAGEGDEVAITFARFNELDPNRNKNGRYEYLVMSDDTVATVPSAQVKGFDAGTSIVHFNLEIPQYAARMTQLQGSLWWLFQNALFDPVLPFWVEERRKAMLGDTKEADRRTIAGNYTRLMDQKSEYVEYQGTVDVTLEHEAGSTNTKVNYWVMKPNPEKPGASAVEAYVNQYRPIAFTFNGQTHGTEERRFISDRLGFPYLAKSLIIQVELDHLSSQARRSLMSSTRDRLKQLGFYEDLCEEIAKALSQDEELIRLDGVRKEQILSKHSDVEREKMKQRFARLMDRFNAGIDAFAKARSTGGGGGRRPPTPGNRAPLAPLPTKDDPTFIKIGNTQKPIPIRLDRQALIRLESDAPDGYLTSHVHAKITVDCDPDGVLKLHSRSDFKGGRSRLTVGPTEKAKDGDSGTLTVVLFTPKDEALRAKATFVVEKAEDLPTSGSGQKSKIDVPEPIEIYKSEWPEFGWNEASVAEVKVSATDTKIYVNMDNQHLARLLQSGSYQEVGIKRMKSNFLLYSAFYAWVRDVEEKAKKNPLSGEHFEDYQQRELDRMAQTVVYSISSLSRLEGEEE